MTRRRSIDETPASALRDYSTDGRVERVWARLESEVGGVRPQRRSVSRYLWIPAGAAAVFCAGMLVGAQWSAERAVAPAVMPEPTPAAEPASAPAIPVADPVRNPPEPKRRAKPQRRGHAQRVTPPPDPAETSAEEASALEPLPVGPPEWQQLADNGQYAEALISVDADGGFPSVLQDATAEQLMLLVEAARFTGQRDRAIVALRRVVSQHGTDPNAPLAAWTLGNELAKAGDPDGAAQAFATYRALSPRGDFAEDALAREFEMALEQGSLEHARKLAHQYAEDFPDAPRGADIRARLADELERRMLPTPQERAVVSELEAEPVGADAGPGR